MISMVVFRMRVKQNQMFGSLEIYFVFLYYTERKMASKKLTKKKRFNFNKIGIVYTVKDQRPM